MLAWLSTFGSWALQQVLQIFLSGLFNTVLTKLQDDAQHQVDAAHLQAQTTVDSANVEIAVAQQQAQVAIDGAKPKPQDDPFGVDQWNQGK